MSGSVKQCRYLDVAGQWWTCWPCSESADHWLDLQTDQVQVRQAADVDTSERLLQDYTSEMQAAAETVAMTTAEVHTALAAAAAVQYTTDSVTSTSITASQHCWSTSWHHSSHHITHSSQTRPAINHIDDCNSQLQSVPLLRSFNYDCHICPVPNPC